MSDLITLYQHYFWFWIILVRLCKMGASGKLVRNGEKPDIMQAPVRVTLDEIKELELGGDSVSKLLAL